MEEEIKLILRQTVDEYGKVYEVLAAKKIMELIESKQTKPENMEKEANNEGIKIPVESTMIQLGNLTKENLFDRLYAQYPRAMKLFCEFIDEYKRSVEWEKLFLPEVKFHDLPIDIQNGIIARFDLEHFGAGPNSYHDSIIMLSAQTEKLIKDLEFRIATC